MSEHPSTPDQQSDSSTPPKPRRTVTKARGVGRWVIVVLMLLVIGLGVQQLATVRFWETLDNEAGQIASADGRLTALEAIVADQDRLKSDIRQMRQSLQQERALLSLDRIEQQVDAGWQMWIATGDPKMLIAALQSAQQMLAKDPTAAAQNLRQVVGQDLTSLKSQDRFDLRLAVARLDTLIAGIDQLPLVQDSRLTAPVAQQTTRVDLEPAETLLERGRQWADHLAQEVWQAIRSLIRVQRLDRAEAGLIAPEQKVFLQQGLRLLLLDARHALIMRNAPIYQQTLAQANAWIRKYADTANARVQTDMEELHSLSELRIDPDVISLEATRQALADMRAALAPETVSLVAAPVTEPASADEAPKSPNSPPGAAQ